MASRESGSVVEAAREALGPVGVYLPISRTETVPIDRHHEAVRRLERAGFGAAWTNETVGGKDALVQLSLLLAATERMAFGTGIANIWSRPAQTAQAAAAQLAQAYPDRLVLGLGVGYPRQAAAVGREYGKPLATMRAYLDRMDEPTVPPAPDAAFARILAANRPKMLALAAERADGALPFALPAAGTAQARKLLGPDKLLVVGVSVVMEAQDLDAARGEARAAVLGSLVLPWYGEALKGFGYTEQQIAEADEVLVDAVVAHGTADAIAATVRGHLAAGADHVVLLPASSPDLSAGVDRLERLAPAVLGG